MKNTIGTIKVRVKLGISWVDIIKMWVLGMTGKSKQISIEEQLYEKGIWRRPLGNHLRNKGFCEVGKEGWL